MTRLTPNDTIGLSKESAADAFPVKSLSVQRFGRRLGVLTHEDMDEIAAAIALCIDYSAP